MKHCLLFSFNARATQRNLAIYCLEAVGKNTLPDWQFDTLELSSNSVFEESLYRVHQKVQKILAISCYIWNIEITRSLIKAIKKIHPDLIVLLGGHEVSHDPQSYLKEGIADYVISGEGELSFAQWLLVMDSGADPSQLLKVPGLSFKHPERGIVRNPAGKDIEPLDQLPSPYHTNSGALAGNFTYYESSRGCVYKCHFCLSALDRGSRFFSMPRVFEDLQKILDQPGIKQIKFVDRTFNLNYKRTNLIWEWLIKNGTGRNFHFEIAAELFHESSLELLKKVPEGMFQFEVGVQSIHKEVLDTNGRRCRLDRLEESLDFLLKNTRVHVHLDLIVGLGGESPSMFQESFDWVFKKLPHHLQIETLKLLKGSISRQKTEEHGYVFLDEPPYSLLHSKLFTYEEVRRIDEVSALLELYFNREALRPVVIEAIHLCNSPWQFFLKFRDFFVEKHPTFSGLHLRRAYTILAEFLQTELSEHASDLLGRLTLDCLSSLKCGQGLPFHKPSRTLSRHETKNLGLNSLSGFVEEFPSETEFRGIKSRYWIVNRHGEEITPFDPGSGVAYANI
ncbi:MAG: DUF4080 domain-containing protein [Candidatus Cloacimonetes bacterium]|nr:DUF4080 domain-containing protein [Candidatus Cloacimonadota bacterium]